ncbi:MAG: hypothetical protein CMH83_13340 [Nocardioides sp.]|nr:hypothetical protein [Nocardioides sp.]
MVDDDPGRRLADWLDGLGLLPFLDEAGLPTVERTADGTATWRDPLTDAVLSDAEVVDVEQRLRAHGTDPRYGVPVPLVQVARQARVRAELLASPTYTYATLAALRGTTENAVRYDVAAAARDRRLLLVPADRWTPEALVPGFQLVADGTPREELAPVLEPLLRAGGDPWLLWGWLTRPAGLLGGLVPERAAADRDDHELVVAAAIRLSERLA